MKRQQTLIILGPALLGLHSLTLSALRLWRTRSPWRYPQLAAMLAGTSVLAVWLIPT